jgi:hypothetical protein
LENKSWTFPIQQYTSLIQKLKFKKDVIIEKDLTAEEIQNIQIVAIGDDVDFIYIQFPKNDELRSLMLKYKSSGNEKKFGWALPKIKKELFY